MNKSLIWRKASYSGGTGGNCVEVAAVPKGGIAVRDSKDCDGTILILSTGQWEDLLKSLLWFGEKRAAADITLISGRGFLSLRLLGNN